MPRVSIGNALFGAFSLLVIVWVSVSAWGAQTPEGKARAAEQRAEREQAHAYAVANGLELLSENAGVRVLRDNKTGCHWLESRRVRAVSLTARTKAGPDGLPVQICDPVTN